MADAMVGGPFEAHVMVYPPLVGDGHLAALRLETWPMRG